MAPQNPAPRPPAPRVEDRVAPAVPAAGAPVPQAGAPTAQTGVPQVQPAVAPAVPLSSAAPISPGTQVAPVVCAAPAVPDASAGETPLEGEKLHVHSSYIWLGGLKSIFAVLFALAVSMSGTLVGLLADGIDPGGGAAIALIIVGITAAGAALVAALAFLGTWWSWRHLYYQITPDEFALYSGIFNKKQVHVPYQRIQSVDQRATLLQRVLGVCTVQIETAGGSSNKAVVVPYVTRDRAEWLRRELFSRKQQLAAGQKAPSSERAVVAATEADGTSNVLDVGVELWDEVGSVFGGQGVETGRVSYEYGLTNKELVLTALSNNTAFVVVLVGLVTGAAQLVGEVLPMFFGSNDAALDFVIDQSLRLFGGNAAVAIAVALISFALVMWGLSVLSTCLTYGGFKARRRDSRIEVERGLLQHQFSGVDVDRVQSVVVRQSLIRRIMGYCELSLGKVDSVTGDGEKQANVSDKGLVIHPFVKMSRVPEILSGLVPEFADVPTAPIPVAAVALRRAILRRAVWLGGGFWCAVVGCVLAAFAPQIAWALADVPSDVDEVLFVLTIVTAGLIALGLVLFVLEVVSAVLWARESSFAVNRSFMQVTNGGLARESVTFPRKKIQFAFTKTNPFQRLARTATIVAVTAAGVGGTKVSLVDAGREEAALWLEWAMPGGQDCDLAGFGSVKVNKGSSQ